MIELHIYLEPREGKGGDLESIYWNEYVPGIMIQEGFQRTTLIKKRIKITRRHTIRLFELEFIDINRHDASNLL